MISVSQSTTFVSEDQSPPKSSRFYQVIVDVHLLSHEEISIGVCVGIKLPHVFDAEYRADSKQPNLCILLAANGSMPVYGPKICCEGAGIYEEWFAILQRYLDFTLKCFWMDWFRSVFHLAFFHLVRQQSK